MNRKNDIEEMSVMFLKSLGVQDGTAVNILIQCNPKFRIEEMISYIWNLKKSHVHLIPKLAKSEKSEVHAKSFREAGNILFQNGDLCRALQSYNQSIMSAPHPPYDPAKYSKSKLKDKEDPESSKGHLQEHCSGYGSQYETLALAFANRSAVLLEQKEYNECLEDIDLALQCGYPKEMQGKLALRKAKCLFALNHTSQVEGVVKTSIQELQSTTPNKTQRENVKKELFELLEKCFIKSDNEVNNSIEPLKTDDFRWKPLVLPELKKVNPSIPALSSSIKIAFSPVKGRMLTAVKNILPGELLCVEESFAWAMDSSDSLASHCSNCLVVCCTPLPCPNCSLVIFCSETCRQEGFEVHSRECASILPTLIDLGEAKLLMLCRILMSIPYTEWKQKIPQLQQEARTIPRVKRGINKDGVYDSKDYKTVFHLVNNKEHWEPIEMVHCCIKAVILTRMLQLSQQFFRRDGKPFKPTQDELKLTASTIVHHLLSIRQNCLHLRSRSGSDSLVMGDGLFPAISLGNHSCNPSARLINHGKYGIVRALRSIPAGQEITLACTRFQVFPLFVRAAKLQYWHFTCSCEACVNDWPVMSRLPHEVRLKCTKCGQLFDMNEDCSSCRNEFQRSRNNLLKSELKNLMCDMSEMTEKPNCSEKFKLTSEIIEFMDKYVDTLCQYYYNILQILEIQMQEDYRAQRE